MTTAEKHLAALRSIATKREALDRRGEELDRRQFAAVLDARLARATWAEVGLALGTSPQAVQQRYHGHTNRP